MIIFQLSIKIENMGIASHYNSIANFYLIRYISSHVFNKSTPLESNFIS